ncbi:hypothetical protein EDD11_000139 [Mortierella claussenii]|nr:hypothetical protein EDD11_000139 [Mortierella claussenii]
MAAENIANLVRGYLEKQQRPEYLQPVAPDGSLPWMASAGAGSSTLSNTTPGNGGSGSTDTTSRSPGHRKRPASTSSTTDGTQSRPKRSAITYISSPVCGGKDARK